MKKKMCVYTCITGNYDNLTELEIIEPEFDYYCFTNNKNIKSNTWKIIYIKNDGLDNLTLARKIKILGYPIINKKYDISIWIDACVVFKQPLKKFIKEKVDLKNDKLFLCKHSQRSTVKEEVAACVRYGKSSKKEVVKIMNYFAKVNFSDLNGLYETTVFIKKIGNKEIIKIMNDWFKLLKKFTRRDQLTLPYVLEKNNYKPQVINLNVFDNEYFDWLNHNLKTDLNSYRAYFDADGSQEIDGIIIDKYEMLGDTYIAKFKIPKDSQYLKFEIAQHAAGVELLDFHISYDKIENINLVNCLNVLEYKMFIDKTPTIFLEGDFKKNEEIEFSIKMKELSKLKLVETIERLNQIIINNK